MKTVNIGVLLLPVALAAVPFSAKAQLSTTTTYSYQCEDGSAFKAEFVPEGAIVYLEDETLNLEQIPAASGARYSDGTTTLFTQENEAFVEVDGETVLNNCVAELDTPEGSTREETTIDESVTSDESTTLEESTEETTTLEGTTTTEQTTIQRTETTQQTTTPAPAQTTPAPASTSTDDSPEPVRALW
jgi:membrane-bound inhibitor of C-type lysozyme